MERNSTTRKNKTRRTHLTWLGVLAASIILFATCYEFTTIDQPRFTSPNTTFEVPVVLKGSEGEDFNHELRNLGVFGILLPEGWMVMDSIPYDIKGVYVGDTPAPFNDTGWVIHDTVTTQMYTDSVGAAPAGYYYWGGISSDTANLDNLDSISLTVTITTDAQLGDFNITYYMGDHDYEERWPDNAISDPQPISVYPTNVETSLKEKISVYPNPASDMMNINVGKIRKGEIQVFDITGRMHHRQAITSRTNRMDVSSFPSGTYILKVRTDIGEHTQKVLIK